MCFMISNVFSHFICILVIDSDRCTVVIYPLHNNSHNGMKILKYERNVPFSMERVIVLVLLKPVKMCQFL